MAMSKGDVKEQQLRHESPTQEAAAEREGRFGEAAHEHDDKQRDGQAPRTTPGVDGVEQKGAKIDEQAYQAHSAGHAQRLKELIVSRDRMIQADLHAVCIVPHRGAVAEQGIVLPFLDREGPEEIPTG